jgi:hypothetical protein
MEVFGLDPDHGDASAEWLVVVVLGVLAGTAALLARREFLRIRLADRYGRVP